MEFVCVFVCVVVGLPVELNVVSFDYAHAVGTVNPRMRCVCVCFCVWRG